MATVTESTSIVPLGIVNVCGITCACGYHESLHTSDPVEAKRTAKELGWRLKPSGDAVCPLCRESTVDNPRKLFHRRSARLQKEISRKAVRS